MKHLEELLVEKDIKTLTRAIELADKTRKTIRVRGWTQYAQARDENGNMVTVDDKTADVFSVYGAMRLHAENDESYDTLVYAIVHVTSQRIRRPMQLGLWNDGFCGSVLDAVGVLDDAVVTLRSFINE